MRLIAGHQPNLYPYGGFFAKAASVAHFVIVDTTQYVKKEYHNRNRVKLADGAAHWLGIPVKTAGRFTQRLDEVEIDPAGAWRAAHVKTLRGAYGRCPHFAWCWARFEELLARDWVRLVDFNMAVIALCMELLGIATPCVRASELGAQGKKTELILDLCRRTGGDAYLHGMHGRDYADFAFLAAHGVASFVQEFSAPHYAQPWGPFVPNLSIIDVLFNCGPDARELLLHSSRIVPA